MPTLTAEICRYLSKDTGFVGNEMHFGNSSSSTADTYTSVIQAQTKEINNKRTRGEKKELGPTRPKRTQNKADNPVVVRTNSKPAVKRGHVFVNMDKECDPGDYDSTPDVLPFEADESEVQVAKPMRPLLQTGVGGLLGGSQIGVLPVSEPINAHSQGHGPVIKKDADGQLVVTQSVKEHVENAVASANNQKDAEMWQAIAAIHEANLKDRRASFDNRSASQAELIMKRGTFAHQQQEQQLLYSESIIKIIVASDSASDDRSNKILWSQSSPLPAEVEASDDGDGYAANNLKADLLPYREMLTKGTIIQAVYETLKGQALERYRKKLSANKREMVREFTQLNELAELELITKEESSTLMLALSRYISFKKGVPRPMFAHH